MPSQKALKKATEDGTRRQELDFRDGKLPGEYDFRVTYRSHSRERNRRVDDGWDGDGLTSAAVRIELVK